MALERADAWQVAWAGKQPAIEAFLQKYPVGPEADAAHTKLKPWQLVYISIIYVYDHSQGCRRLRLGRR